MPPLHVTHRYTSYGTGISHCRAVCVLRADRIDRALAALPDEALSGEFGRHDYDALELAATVCSAAAAAHLLTREAYVQPVARRSPNAPEHEWTAACHTQLRHGG